MPKFVEIKTKLVQKSIWGNQCKNNLRETQIELKKIEIKQTSNP